MTTTPPILETPKDAVLEKIRAGAVTMRPKFYFILKAFVVALVAVLILALSIFLASFIFFSFRLNGSDSLLSFGPRGVMTFFQIFPWVLAILDIALIAFLEWLLRRFRFAYSRPMLYILIALIAVVTALSLLVASGTRFHDQLLEHADRDELPLPLGAFYEGAREKPQAELGVFRGEVTEVREDTFVITNDDTDQDEDDGTWEVAFPEDFDHEGIDIGDRVFVAGDHDGEEVSPYGVKVIHHREDDD